MTKKEEIEEEKEEKLTETLEELEGAVEEEVESKAEEVAEVVKKGKRRSPIAVFLESPEVQEQITALKELAENGLAKTQKNIIIFYEQATKVGDRVRGFLYILVGASVFFAGLLATKSDIFSLGYLVSTLMQGVIGRIVAVGIGISLAAFGISRLFAGVLTKIMAKRKREKQKYVQRKLVDK